MSSPWEPFPKEMRDMIAKHGAEKILKRLFKEFDEEPISYGWPMQMIMKMCYFHREAFLKEIYARRAKRLDNRQPP